MARKKLAAAEQLWAGLRHRSAAAEFFRCCVNHSIYFNGRAASVNRA